MITCTESRRKIRGKEVAKCLWRKTLNSDSVKAKAIQKFSFGVCNSQTFRPAFDLVLRDSKNGSKLLLMGFYGGGFHFDEIPTLSMSDFV